MNDSNNTEFAEDAHPPIVLKFDGQVDAVDTTPLDSVGVTEDGAPILEVEHGVSTDDAGNTTHRYNVVLREGAADSPKDLQRSWEDDDGVTDDGKNVSMDHRSWGDN